MAAASNGQLLRDLPSADSTRRGAPRRAEIVPDAPAGVTHSDVARVRVLFAGASLMHAQAPSLAALWAHHAACAAHYRSWWLRLPRYAWGGVHAALAAVLRAAEWVTDSPPKLLVAAAVVTACWYWS